MKTRLVCLITLLLTTSSMNLFSQTPVDSASQTLASLFSTLSSLLEKEPDEETVRKLLNSLLGDVFNLIAETSEDKDVNLLSTVNELQKKCSNDLKKTFENLSNTDRATKKHHSTHEEKVEKAEAALLNVATIASGVANIIQSPHDKQNIGQSVGSILSGIINIAMIASHKPREKESNITPQATI